MKKTSLPAPNITFRTAVEALFMHLIVFIRTYNYKFGFIAIVVAFLAGSALKSNTISIPANTKSIEFAEPAEFRTEKNAPTATTYTYGTGDVQFIKECAKLAQSEMYKYGIPASITLAQGLLESRAGSSKLAINARNFFGVKCFSRRCEKGHCINMPDDTHKDMFKVYKTRWESFREHSKILSSGRYAKLKKYGHDYRKWAYGLKACGYASDRNYAKVLIGVIERYELYKYDR